jgi:hypothetical protein
MRTAVGSKCVTLSVPNVRLARWVHVIKIFRRACQYRQSARCILTVVLDDEPTFTFADFRVRSRGGVDQALAHECSTLLARSRRLRNKFKVHAGVLDAIDHHRHLEFILYRILIHVLPDGIISEVALEYIVPFVRLKHILVAPSSLYFVVLNSRGDFGDAFVRTVVGCSVPAINLANLKQITRACRHRASAFELQSGAVAFGKRKPCVRAA